VNATPQSGNPAPIGEAEARALADAIEQVSRNQSPETALKMIEMALVRAPQQPIVLNAAAGYMLRTGNAARARALSERAVAADSGSKVLWLNLAAACRALGELRAEAEALEKALSLDPRYMLALLQKGDLLQRLGKTKAAAMMFEGALASAARAGTVPPQLATVLGRARDVVLANQREMEAFLDQHIGSLLSESASEDQARFKGCRDIVLGKRRVYASEPKSMLFPYLPAIEFFERRDFPWLDILEAGTEDIAAEALAVLSNDGTGFKPYVEFPPGAPLDQWAPLNHSMDWSTYSLLHDGTRVEAHIEKCPKTAAVLERLPLCDVPGYAPGAYFSVLKPRTRLPPHTGTTNTRSIVHLPLVVPERCEFRVGSQVRAWQKGKAWVFDDTIEHEAWNGSDETRIILIFDIWNPLLTQTERDLVRALTIGMGHYYGEDAPVLGSR
jgi:aspartyl/asparaginyl beta-hydroxylase (cupin superfamily)/Tfp pilus assembly protein PilF